MAFESVERFVERTVVSAVYPAAMPSAAKGHVERLPSGSFRVSVYAGVDPLTRQEIRLRSTVKELQAQIELGRLLKEASEGRTPESHAAGMRATRRSPGFLVRTLLRLCLVGESAGTAGASQACTMGVRQRV